MRVLFAALVALIAGASSFASLAASPKQIVLRFDDNLVPFGWTLSYPPPGLGTNYGIADGRLFAGPTTNTALLKTPYTVRSDTKNITIEWYGPLFYSAYGAIQQSQLVESYELSLASMARVYPNNNLFGAGTRVQVGTPEPVPPIEGQFSLPDGIYRFVSVYTEKGITFSGYLNGQLMFQVSNPGPGVVFSKVTFIDLFVFQTSGPLNWMDNVKITQYPCLKPVKGICV